MFDGWFEYIVSVALFLWPIVWLYVYCEWLRRRAAIKIEQTFLPSHTEQWCYSATFVLGPQRWSSLTELACPRMSLVRLWSRACEYISMEAIEMVRTTKTNMIKVNCQLKKEPNMSPKPSVAALSKISPRRVSIICWKANASDERRKPIAPELFWGKSKYATSCRRRQVKALARIRCVIFEPDKAKAPYYRRRKEKSLSHILCVPGQSIELRWLIPRATSGSFQ